MSRRPTTQPKAATPLDNKQRELQAKADSIRADLQNTRQFLDRAPVMKAEVQKRQQHELVQRYQRPQRVEGPADIRFDLRKGSTPARRVTLRKERSKAPILTFILMLMFSAAVIYACRVLLQG